MSSTIFVATNHGLFTCRRDSGEWQVVGAGLEENDVTSVIAREGVILAGSTDGVFRSDDDGHTWNGASEGLGVRHVRWMAFHPEVSDFEFAGTEPADIFISHDGGQSWRECKEVAKLRDQYRWMLPYSKEAGCVRGFAFHGSHAYAAVEVGGLLQSEDGGETWRLAEGSNGIPDLDGPPEPLIYPDVHSVLAASTDLAGPAQLYAPTGGGFYKSEDGGSRWTLLYDYYCRAVWVDPSDASHLVLGPAHSVGSEGWIAESRDGGKDWAPVAGFEQPWPDKMVERLLQIDDELFAVLSNGELLSTPVANLDWRQILPDVEGTACVTAMQP